MPVTTRQRKPSSKPLVTAGSVAAEGEETLGTEERLVDLRFTSKAENGTVIVVQLKVPARMLIDQAALERSFESQASMLRSLTALGPALRSAAPDASPQMARAVQARENFYDRIRAAYGLLTSDEAGQLMGSRAKRPANTASAARDKGRLVALDRGRYALYPGFQFDDAGKPRPLIASLRSKAERVGLGETDLVEWLCAPTNYLDGSAPADVAATDPDLVLSAADDLLGIDW